ncbi:probable serine/threonine-protein kinase drkC [Sycon ciliatum]|uniref:probable serine/threonine-protein kinase drkC n=1 Tax=Sycon ciliatum TaxID=27933 RepID=UPI0031F6738F
MRILGHFVLGNMVIGGSGLQTGAKSQIYLPNTSSLCPVGFGRDERSHCKPCPIGKYSPSLEQQCIKCNQSLTTVGEAASHCVPEGPCKDNTCNGHGECLVNKANFKHICVCRFGYLTSDDCDAPAVYLILMASLVFATTLTTLVIALIQFLRKTRALNAKEIELVNTNRDLYRSNRKLSQINHGTCIAWSDLKIQRQLAEGRFCKVLLAELGDMAVVVKRLPPFVSTASPYDSFIQEAEVLRTLSHPNIVLFLGAGKDKQSKCPFLVMEYLMRGSLCDVLHDPSNKIDHADRLRFTLDAARGVNYLHNRDPPMIHRDIKSANMLVSDKWVVKIADMETARFLAILHPDGIELYARETGCRQARDHSTRTASDTTHSDKLTTPLLGATSVKSGVDRTNEDRATSTRAMEGMTSRIGMTCGVGTDRWRSPESIKKNLYTEKHDVYSFGVVMWELSTRQIPYAHLSNSDDILDEIADGTKPIFPSNIPYGYSHIAEQCIKTDLQERPSMQRIVQELLSQIDGN